MLLRIDFLPKMFERDCISGLKNEPIGVVWSAYGLLLWDFDREGSLNLGCSKRRVGEVFWMLKSSILET